jgi:hypothetical protein
VRERGVEHVGSAQPRGGRPEPGGLGELHLQHLPAEQLPVLLAVPDVADEEHVLVRALYLAHPLGRDTAAALLVLELADQLVEVVAAAVHAEVVAGLRDEVVRPLEVVVRPLGLQPRGSDLAMATPQG